MLPDDRYLVRRAARQIPSINGSLHSPRLNLKGARSALFSLPLMLLTVVPSLALEPLSFHCVATDFLDDSRYPSGDEFTERNRAITFSIIDEGDRLVVETQGPGSESDTRQLPVIKRTKERVVGEIADEQSTYSLMLEISEEPSISAAGSLIYQTYEVDHRWLFRCAG